MSQGQTFEFKAEINQLLEILVHSLYTNREIFLRELVSNASDALEKLRFAKSADGDSVQDDIPLEIRIDLDKDNKTLTITDTGVGMTRDEVMKNIGTIAHSGSAEFARKAAEGKESIDSLIGRFGVGFYSVYMVADTVQLTTRSFHDDAEAIVWTSDGRNAYELTEGPADAPRGTKIEVRLKEDLAEDFTDPYEIKRVIKTHSNFVSFPVFVDGERVNTVPALWREPKFQITSEQYEEFYKFLSYDTDGPLETMHISVDAPVQFSALLFVPKTEQEPFALQGRDEWGQDLYVRRVLIQKQNKDLLPEYLSFITGVVDTEDLPLNISRETLQDNLLIRKIKTTLTKQVLSHLEKVAKDNDEQYAEFWKAHNKMFKTGYMDFPNRETFARLLRFDSSHFEDEEGLTDFESYIERSREGQTEIYYAYVPSREAAKLNPHLEIFRRKGIEVLYLYEPVDEFLMDGLREHRGFKFVAAEHADPETLKKFEDVTAPEDKPEELAEADRTDMEKMAEAVKELLGEKVSAVKLSSRLTGSPCCLVNPDGHTTGSMEKIMRVMSKDSSVPVKVMELNPDHAMVRNLLKIYKKNHEDAFFEKAAKQLYESALLLEGYLDDPHSLVGRIQELLTMSSGWYAERD